MPPIPPIFADGKIPPEFDLTIEDSRKFKSPAIKYQFEVIFGGRNLFFNENYQDIQSQAMQTLINPI